MSQILDFTIKILVNLGPGKYRLIKKWHVILPRDLDYQKPL